MLDRKLFYNLLGLIRIKKVVHFHSLTMENYEMVIFHRHVLNVMFEFFRIILSTNKTYKTFLFVLQ